MATANFQRTLAGLKKDQVIIPVIRAALSNPKFTGFSVPVRGWREGVRKFDGWFHPSTHASWTARQLTYYLLHGAEIPPEPPTLTYVAAVTQGSFWHNFNQRLLIQEGVLRRNPGTTAKDDIEAQCEIALVDDEHNRRGHADGRMATVDDELFEFKTMNDVKIKKFTDEIVLREENPYGYYSQAQDYLDIAGLPKMRYFIMSLASPFPMQEFVVHANPGFQRRQREKYLQAIESAQQGGLPDACCGIGSAMAKSCPVASFCPVGRVSA